MQILLLSVHTLHLLPQGLHDPQPLLSQLQRLSRNVPTKTAVMETSSTSNRTRKKIKQNSVGCNYFFMCKAETDKVSRSCQFLKFRTKLLDRYRATIRCDFVYSLKIESSFVPGPDKVSKVQIPVDLVIKKRTSAECEK